ncbi:MAG TPA: MoaD/ThiS family protein [Verrucomicrobiae bacterium]|nr:MoaD/ThiS family protein [Verrucomicrobiae bacterium]
MAAPETQIRVTVNFFSFFKELTGCAVWAHSVPAGTTLAQLVDLAGTRFPRVEPMKRSMLVAVGVEYQERWYVLKDKDEVSLFPPVQGG